jgi:hypothetical protein
MVYSYSNNEMNSTLARGDIYRVYLPVFELAAASSLDLSWTYVCPWLLTDGPIPDLYLDLCMDMSVPHHDLI